MNFLSTNDASTASPFCSGSSCGFDNQPKTTDLRPAPLVDYSFSDEESLIVLEKTVESLSDSLRVLGMTSSPRFDECLRHHVLRGNMKQKLVRRISLKLFSEEQEELQRKSAMLSTVDRMISSPRQSPSAFRRFSPRRIVMSRATRQKVISNLVVSPKRKPSLFCFLSTKKLCF
ncbi:uncharacterized protein LOC121378347 [Gigantopelta aegis]|uniref:uncharacterized protein LOC121378347 n=1 Tax=Gigantopelta aegis TaxID=1735272 RepID=UPI001B887776|nr:uncharacterized protein LOC121378347 [Gigantopelta aegis]